LVTVQSLGVKGSIGVAEDTSDASISCRQTGKLSLAADVRSGKADSAFAI